MLAQGFILVGSPRRIDAQPAMCRARRTSSLQVAALFWFTLFGCLGSGVLAEEVAGNKLKELAARKIQEGLNPHHATGSHPEDPLLRKHRFQLHDFETDHLTYYEYEARLHAHVVMLEDLGVVSCVVRPMAENRTTIALVVTANAKLEKVQLDLGSIVVGKVNCTAVVGSAEKRWTANLQQRIVEEPVVTKLDVGNDGGSIRLSIVTQPAQMHECFESSQLEFFRGKTHAFEEARRKRHASFATKGESTPPDNFTDAIKVVAEAKAAERELNRALAAPRKEQHRNTSRRLNHNWRFCRWRHDFQLELIGTDCGDNVDGGDDCYWKRDSDYLLRPGGRYRLRWDGFSNRNRVKIGLYEQDYTDGWKSWLNGNDWCSNIPTLSGGWHYYRRGNPANVNELSFTMPDWPAIQGCASSDGGGLGG